MKLFAFWSYDQFPYLLGAPITEVRADGTVRVESYGGAYFTPVLLLPEEAGRDKLQQLQELERQHAKARRDFDARWREAAAKVFNDVANNPLREKP